jgi:uncharacterized YigZ family protein
VPVENTYKTIAQKAEGLYKEKGSKFLAFGFPVTDESEVKSIVSSLRKKYHDARHHCYAYRIGTDPFRYRANDDGEPSGTAGKPIYGQIVSHDLTNILIVVVRYFGGTLLGKGGLAVAYRSAAASMISASAIMEKSVMITCFLTLPYSTFNGLMKIVKEEGIEHSHPVYGNPCTLTVFVPLPVYERFSAKLKLLEGITCEQIHENPGEKSYGLISEKVPLRHRKSAKT